MSEKFARLTLDVVGFSELELAKFRRYIKEPYGMVLVTGPTGSGKTTLLRTLARALHLKYSRIQFTPDLMPADIVGSMIIETSDRGAKSLVFQPGPVFAHLVLADEINRTPPKTQAALLQAMQEREVTISGRTYKLAEPFFVLATQNPIEYEGTFPLPEAQLDRFLIKLRLGYLSGLSPADKELTDHQRINQIAIILGTALLVGVNIAATSAMAANVSAFTVTRGATEDEIKVVLSLALGSGENVVLQTKVYPKNLPKAATYKNFFQNWMDEVSS
jgi:energy-coupling factor transporter ATP-binding protein EcfA2